MKKWSVSEKRAVASLFCTNTHVHRNTHTYTQTNKHTHINNWEHWKAKRPQKTLNLKHLNNRATFLAWKKIRDIVLKNASGLVQHTHTTQARSWVYEWITCSKTSSYLVLITKQMINLSWNFHILLFSTFCRDPQSQLLAFLHHILVGKARCVL